MTSRRLSLVERDAQASVAELAPAKVSELRAVLQAHTRPREFAAAVCLNLDPMLQEARRDRDEAKRVLDEYELRVVKLERLAAAAEDVAVGVVDAASFRVVSGKQIAVVAVQEAKALGRSELHYGEWFGLVREAGWVVEAKDGKAAFLLSLSRSRLVERVGRGVYRIKEET